MPVGADNPMPESTLSPKSGIYEFGFRPRWALGKYIGHIQQHIQRSFNSYLSKGLVRKIVELKRFSEPLECPCDILQHSGQGYSRAKIADLEPLARLTRIFFGITTVRNLKKASNKFLINFHNK